MRLRNIPGAREAVAASSYCISDPAGLRGKWADFLGNNNPIHLEIGMGKGKCILQLASLHPDINYIGIERYESVLIRALQKLQVTPLSNVHFLCEDAIRLPEFFTESEVGRIYLNFSDPWPKDRHSKRRLTSRQYLSAYEQILIPGGQIEFKTDNLGLFEFSMQEITEQPNWQLLASTHDLHHDPVMNVGNIMTEYEEKFSGEGNPICKLIAEYL
ncbi:MAG: tRNA (guanosine(46)-N7)-methyltransferase TrmB [Clostridiales bacterium]|nr:tRNA (guanosine(46)-N7)-methyltransferase TrmB [Clostridiales bacterium]